MGGGTAFGPLVPGFSRHFCAVPALNNGMHRPVLPCFLILIVFLPKLSSGECPWYLLGKMVLYQRLYIRNHSVACIFKMERDLDPTGNISSLYKQGNSN